jgi:hypothetical protein
VVRLYESGPIADIDQEQSNVRFGEKQTSAQNSFGFLLIEFLTILALTDKARRNTPSPGSVYTFDGLLPGKTQYKSWSYWRKIFDYEVLQISCSTY